MKKLILTETDLVDIINKIVKEQALPRHIRKGSKEHADWVRSQQGDGSDELLEKLLEDAQRLIKFVEYTRDEKNNWKIINLIDIQAAMNTDITNYLNLYK
tara:strand:- start:70 stop:369 length:300 start_codon:yes stop_codon:yes gene_type:complete